MAQMFVVPGTDAGKRALVVAGIHGSELSGIEVANWLRVKLLADFYKGRRPTYTTLIVPEVFPKQAQIARAKRSPGSKADSPVGRYVEHKHRDKRGKLIATLHIEPNRQFPPPGEPSARIIAKGSPIGPDGKPLKAGGVDIPLLEEIKELLTLIEWFKPSRITALHAHSVPGGPAKKGTDWPGIFVDPRYTYPDRCTDPSSPFDLNRCKFDLSLDPAFVGEGPPQGKRAICARTSAGQDDDRLALALAKAVEQKDPSLVPGNHLKDPPEIVHYCQSRKPPSGFSLGDWGPVAVGKDPGRRDGAPVITIEVPHQYDSGAFQGGEQMMGENCQPLPGRPKPKGFDSARCRSLQVYADALIKVFLR